MSTRTPSRANADHAELEHSVDLGSAPGRANADRVDAEQLEAGNAGTLNADASIDYVLKAEAEELLAFFDAYFAMVADQPSRIQP